MPTGAPIDQPSEPATNEFERQVLRTLQQLEAAVNAAGSR